MKRRFTSRPCQRLQGWRSDKAIEGRWIERLSEGSSTSPDGFSLSHSLAELSQLVRPFKCDDLSPPAEPCL
jgi:hypothetical protein